MILLHKFCVSSFELLYSNSDISAKIGMPRPPSFGGSANNLLSWTEQLTPPVIAGINSAVIKSSFFFHKTADVWNCSHEIGEFMFISSNKTTKRCLWLGFCDVGKHL